MNTQHEIRAATLADIPPIARLYVDSWQRTYAGIVPQWYLDGMHYAGAEKIWSDYMLAPGQLIFVAVDPQGAVAGMLAAQVEWEYAATAYIAALHVDTAAQGQGLARRLIQAAAAHFACGGITRLGLAVIEGNDNALAIYQHLGAKKVDYRINKEDFPSTEYILIWPDSRVLL